MTTIDDIKFDTDYSYASTFFLLLHDQHLPVKLAHANILTFIRRFHDLFDCQQYVDKNRQKMITLFTTNTKFLDWNTNINVIDDNLYKLFIYCDTPRGHINMKQWNGRYHAKIQEVFMKEDLDYRLLYVGVDYLKTVCDELHEDRGLREKFRADANRICRALGDYFGSQATQLSEENTEY